MRIQMVDFVRSPGIGEESERTVWRSLFLALGVYLCIIGAECLVVQKVTFRSHRPVRVENNGLLGTVASVPRPKEEYAPRDWAPWSFMATGAIVCLYSITLARRMGK